MKTAIIEFINKFQLESAQLNGMEWTKHWLRHKHLFFHKFQRGLIFSTVHGIDFFQNVLDCIEGRNSWSKDEYKGEYENNFRDFIKALK